MKILSLIILGAGLSLPLSVFAGDLAQGKIKAKQSCAVCHGLDGQATVPLAAHISGQQRDYMIIQLRAYRSGKRHHDQMSIIAKPLTNEDIDNVSEWYSNIKVIIKVPKELDAQEKPNESSSAVVKKNMIENGSDTKSFSDMEKIDSELIKSIQKSMQAFIK